VAFGGGRLLAENTRDEQRKMIKYHHLVANLLIFHNVVTMTKALQLLMADGNPIDEESLACLSPYQTEHINRFGRYALNRDRVPGTAGPSPGFAHAAPIRRTSGGKD